MYIQSIGKNGKKDNKGWFTAVCIEFITEVDKRQNRHNVYKPAITTVSIWKSLIHDRMFVMLLAISNGK